MPGAAGGQDGRSHNAWERAWSERYETAPHAGAREGRRRPRRGPVRDLILTSVVLAVAVSSIAVAESGGGNGGDPAVTAARGEGSALRLGERNPGSGGSSRETAMVANAGRGGLVLRPSNTAKGGRAVSATCDNDGTAAEDGCAVYVNKGTGAAASFRTQGSVPFALRDTNTGRVEFLNADMVDGVHASELVRSGQKVGDADTLDGKDSSAFLGSSAKAADANALDGKDSSAFLETSDKAADSNTLDGKDSTEFLGSTAKAADSNTLDGVDSLGFARLAGRVESTGTITGGSGFTVTKLPGNGSYFVGFPAGTFGSTCRPPIAVVSPATGSLRFAIVAGSQCSADGSGGFTVETYNNDAAFTQADTTFQFVAY